MNAILIKRLGSLHPYVLADWYLASHRISPKYEIMNGELVGGHAETQVYRDHQGDLFYRIVINSSINIIEIPISVLHELHHIVEYESGFSPNVSAPLNIRGNITCCHHRDYVVFDIEFPKKIMEWERRTQRR